MAAARRPAFEVVSAHALHDAMESLSARPCDVVVLDLGLPDVVAEMDGVRVLHGAHPGLPIVVLTGVDPDPEVRAEARAAGAADCLFKQGLGPELLHGAIMKAMVGMPAGPAAEHQG